MKPRRIQNNAAKSMYTSPSTTQSTQSTSATSTPDEVLVEQVQDAPKSALERIEDQITEQMNSKQAHTSGTKQSKRIQIRSYSTPNKTHSSKKTATFTHKQFKQLITNNPKAAAQALQKMINNGRSAEAQKWLLEALQGGSPEEQSAASYVLGVVAKSAVKSLPNVIRTVNPQWPAQILMKLLPKSPGVGLRALSFLQGVSSLYPIIMLFKNSYDWIKNNYNQAQKSHVYTGHTDALAHFYKSMGSSKNGGTISNTHAHKMMQTLAQKYEQKLNTQLAARHGRGVTLSTTGKGHMVQQDIDNHKQMLQNYKKGLQQGLLQHNRAQQDPMSKIILQMVCIQAEKNAGGRPASVADYRTSIQKLFGPLMEQKAGLQ